MGTSWDLYCLDCDDDADVSAGHDPIRQHELTPLIAHAAAIGSLAALGGWTLREGGDYSVCAPIDWLAKHGTHRLRMRNEYGEVDGQCSMDVKCGHCGSHRGYCVKDAGHDGACATDSLTPVRPTREEKR